MTYLPKSIDIQLSDGYWINHIHIYQQGANKIDWDNIICDQLSINEIYIGYQYLGIQNWHCFGSPPPIYPSAIFPETSFAKSFDIEVTERFRSVSLYTDFNDPYISTLQHPSGVNYLKFIKDVLKSEEYQRYKQPGLNLFRFAEIGSVENLKRVFPNNSKLALTLQDIVSQKMNIQQYRNWIVGEIVFRGFTVTMDFPSKDGIFENNNFSTEELVYVRSITYGSSAYFIIGSNLSYNEVRSIISTPSIVDNISKKLSDSSIVFISNSSLGQNAILSTSFEAINRYIKEPYESGDYGYPIYC